MAVIETTPLLSRISYTSTLTEDSSLSDELEHFSVAMHGVNLLDDESGLGDDLSCMASLDASTVQSSPHLKGTGVRNELQTHLRSAMQNGNELLDELRGVGEYIQNLRNLNQPDTNPACSKQCNPWRSATKSFATWSRS